MIHQKCFIKDVFPLAFIVGSQESKKWPTTLICCPWRKRPSGVVRLGSWSCWNIKKFRCTDCFPRISTALPWIGCPGVETIRSVVVRGIIWLMLLKRKTICGLAFGGTVQTKKDQWLMYHTFMTHCMTFFGFDANWMKNKNMIRNRQSCQIVVPCKNLLFSLRSHAMSLVISDVFDLRWVTYVQFNF